MSKLNGNHIFSEGHGEDLVSYIYGDIPAERQAIFEAHLLDCDHCTNELAMFSEARLGVIEWRRQEFESLSTPEILLPTRDVSCAQPVADKASNGFAGWLESLRSFSNLVKAGVGLVAAVLAVGFIYLAGFSPGGKSEVAADFVSVVDSPQSNAVIASPPDTSWPIAETEGVRAKYAGTQPKYPKPIEQAPHQIKAANAQARSVTYAKVQKAETAANRKAPRLNSFDEEEDRSLRLSDLFAEIGNSRDE